MHGSIGQINPARCFFAGAEVAIDAAAWAALPAGEVTITFYANDTLGNEQTYPVMVAKEAEGNWGWAWAAGIGGAAVASITIGIGIKKRRRP